MNGSWHKYFEVTFEEAKKVVSDLKQFHPDLVYYLSTLTSVSWFTLSPPHRSPEKAPLVT